MNNYSPTASEEGRIIERIRVSYIKHRGNLIRVLDEVKLPQEYVEKIVTKLRKENKSDTKRLVADTILEHLLLGHQSRVQHAEEILATAEKEEKQLRSSCCTGNVRKMHVDGVDLQELQYECLKCGEMCDIYYWIDQDAMNLRLNAIDSLRREDESLIKFLEKLGYTEKKEQPPQTVIQQQNIVVMPNAQGQVSAEDMKNIQALRPMEQEQLRLNIEKELLEAEVIEDVEDVPPDVPETPNIP
jgi:hypothetical protein